MYLRFMNICIKVLVLPEIFQPIKRKYRNLMNSGRQWLYGEQKVRVISMHFLRYIYLKPGIFFFNNIGF